MSITAKELIENDPVLLNGIGELVCIEECLEDIERLMIEYGKIKVAEALDSASQKVYYTTQRDNYRNIKEVYIDKESILNAYPIDLIK